MFKFISKLFKKKSEESAYKIWGRHELPLPKGPNSTWTDRLIGQEFVIDGYNFVIVGESNAHEGISARLELPCKSCGQPHRLWLSVTATWDDVLMTILSFAEKSCDDCNQVLNGDIDRVEEEMAKNVEEWKGIEKALVASGLDLDSLDLLVNDSGEVDCVSQFLWLKSGWVPLWLYSRRGFPRDLSKINELKHMLGVNAHIEGNLICFSPIHVMRPSRIEEFNEELAELRKHQNTMEAHRLARASRNTSSI